MQYSHPTTTLQFARHALERPDPRAIHPKMSVKDLIYRKRTSPRNSQRSAISVIPTPLLQILAILIIIARYCASSSSQAELLSHFTDDDLSSASGFCGCPSWTRASEAARVEEFRESPRINSHSCTRAGSLVCAENAVRIAGPATLHFGEGVDWRGIDWMIRREDVARVDREDAQLGIGCLANAE